ncbi:gluconokinase [Massilia arenae]|uniref:Gluconokinase n=1 Tax=Massilia arenae TaxID=2603288 RepID=A0A5C7FRC8_9BURK|nr:gluconokinase [Massilia arenae]TXF96912.1 gluconokinase [Massilia arenae]
MTTQARDDNKGTAWIVMGVSGCGKSSIGAKLAFELGVPFIEGDAFHSEANVAKMSAGVPLTDDDRRDWLLNLRDKLAAREGGAVLSCSSLKRAYRDLLRSGGGDVRFAHLAGPREVLLERVSNRPGHYMPPSLLDSQLSTLEPLQPDEAGITLDIRDSQEQLVAQILASV